MKALMLQEAYRLVDIQEGGKKIKLPLVHVMIRKMGVLAAQGNARAMREYMDLLRVIEEEKSALYSGYLKKLFDYKMDVGEEFQRRKKLNPSEPAPLPHPDDIIVNFATGAIELRGPMTKEEEVWWNRIEDCEVAITVRQELVHKRKERELLARAVPDYKPRPSRRKQRKDKLMRAVRRTFAEWPTCGNDGHSPEAETEKPSDK
jgi:hypothetical protein